MHIYAIKQGKETIGFKRSQNQKEAVLAAAEQFEINPFFLSAEEWNKTDARQLLVEEAVERHIAHDRPDISEEERQGVVESILSDQDAWKLIETLVRSYVITYPGTEADPPSKPSLELVKGSQVDQQV